jgi:hypothetical protein
MSGKFTGTKPNNLKLVAVGLAPAFVVWGPIRNLRLRTVRNSNVLPSSKLGLPPNGISQKVSTGLRELLKETNNCLAYWSWTLNFLA